MGPKHLVDRAAAPQNTRMQPELALDHLVVAAQSLSEGTEFVEATLGVKLSDVGHHDRMGTHNRLLSLGPDVYFEVIAIDPAVPQPDHVRWYDLDAFSGRPRLTHWACRTPDLAEMLQIAPRGSGAPMSFERDAFRWQMAVPKNGKLPYDGAMPALIQWNTPHHPAPLLDDLGVRLRSFEVSHPSAEGLRENFPILESLEKVTLRTGQDVAMKAVFDTPDGEKVLA